MDLVDKDGFIASLFYYLWLKDPIKQAVGVVPSVLIPDTIVYHNSSPVVWYFTQGGCIKQRAKGKLNSAYIKEFLLCRKSRCGAVALWINEDDSGCSVYEYLDETSLDRLFEGEASMKKGVLQAIVDPKGDHNCTLNDSILLVTIRSIWGTKLCFFERYMNKQKFDDYSVDMYQRILTYEVDKMQQETQTLVGTVLTSRLENQAFTIANHIQCFTHDQICITRLVLNYRIDEQDRLWLLGCTSMRVQDKQIKQSMKPKKPIYHSNAGIKLPSYLDLKRLPLSNQLSIQIDSQCQKCDKQLNRNDLYPVKVKDIVESWNFDHIGQTNTYDQALLIKKKARSDVRKSSMFANLKKDGRRQTISPFFNEPATTKQQTRAQSMDPLPGLPIEIDKNYRVPDLIRKLMPRLKERKYLECLHNPTFMEIQIEVCQECFIDINKGVNVKEDLSKMAHQERLISKPFDGMGGLNPTLTRKRFQATRRDIINKEKQQFEDSSTLRSTELNSVSDRVTVRRKKYLFEDRLAITSTTFRDLSHKLFNPVLKKDGTGTHSHNLARPESESGSQFNTKPFLKPYFSKEQHG